MKSNLFSAVKLTMLCIFLFAGLYTAIVWGIAMIAAPNHGEGKIAIVNNKTVGFSDIGQSFTGDKYFMSRPSAVNYNSAGSGGSNKGPSNPDYLITVGARIDTFLIHNPDVKRSSVPAELVTASGSGLDPDLSYAAALIQVPRVAKTRRISDDLVRKIVDENLEKPLLGLFGPSTVNVLAINIALDNVK